MDSLQSQASGVWPGVDTELFKLGETSVTPLSLLIFVGTLALAVLIGRLLSAGIRRFFSRRSGEGVGYALGRMVQILATIVGVMVGLENVGIDMTALAALGAMLSVGIGFGLQGVAQNFVSGITLLVERPISKGDFVVVGDTVGVVDEIAMRATRIITRDRVAIIVPNSSFVTDRVTNMSKPDSLYRASVNVGVAYGSDTALVKRLLLEQAQANAAVKAEPAPEVFFRDFGNSSLDFRVCFWLDTPADEPRIASELRFAIDATFRENGVEIPFPQRDLHLRSGFEKLTAA